MSLVDCMKRKASKVKESRAKRPKLNMEENDGDAMVCGVIGGRKYPIRRTTFLIAPRRSPKTSALGRRRASEQRPVHLTPFSRKPKKAESRQNAQPPVHLQNKPMERERSMNLEAGKKSSADESSTESNVLHDVTNSSNDAAGCHDNVKQDNRDIISHDFENKLNIDGTLNYGRQIKSTFKRNRISAAEAAASISNSFLTTAAPATTGARPAAATATAAGTATTVTASAATTKTSVRDSSTNTAITITAARTHANTKAATGTAKTAVVAKNATTFGKYTHTANYKTSTTTTAISINTIAEAANTTLAAGVSLNKHAKYSIAATAAAACTAGESKLPVAAKSTAADAPAKIPKPAVEGQLATVSANAAVVAARGGKAAAGGGGRQVKQRRADDHDVFPGYEEDILKHFLCLETKFQIAENFIKNQNKITTDNRELLLDWIVQVQVHEKLSDVTFHLTVQLLDLYIWKKGGVDIGRLQLVGVACLLVASKYEDRYPPTISQLIYLTDFSYKDTEVLDMERQVLITMSFQIPSVTGLCYLSSLIQSISHLVTLDESDTIKMMTHYLLDLTTMSEYFSSVLPSVKSTSAVALALTLVTNHKHGQSSPVNLSTNRVLTRSRTVDRLCRCSGMLSLSKMAAGHGTGARIVVSSVSQKEVVECMKELLSKLKSISNTDRKGVYTKFSTPMYLSISTDEYINAASTFVEL